MRALLTVNAVEVSGCPANTSASTVVARMFGEFFNAGPGTPTSRINNVGSTVQLQRASNSGDAAGVLRALGVVFQCTTSDCGSVAVLSDVDLGTAAIGEAVSFKMNWEPQSNRFSFARGSAPYVYAPYAVSDSQPAYQPYRILGTWTFLANCFSGNRTEGLIDAKFDNISVNASAAP